MQTEDDPLARLPPGWAIDETTPEEIEAQRAVYEPFTQASASWSTSASAARWTWTTSAAPTSTSRPPTRC